MNCTWKYPQLKTIELQHDYEKAATKLEGELPAPTHADRTIYENTLLLTPSATITALLLKQSLNLKLCHAAYNVCTTLNDSLEHRPAAVGSKSMPRIKKNGRLGAYYVVPDSVMDILDRGNVRQGLLGAVGGASTNPAQLSALTRERPELLDQVRTLIEEVNHRYRKYLPDAHDAQRAEVKKTPNFRLWHTAFSSVYIPKNLRSGYHQDSWNLLGAMSALLPLGIFKGGELVLPRWRIAIAFEPGDLLFFNPQELHGNLVFEGERASMVCYCARNLCGLGK
jgi:hypothetical protein